MAKKIEEPEALTMETVYACDLLHEGGRIYRIGDPVTVSPERAARLVEIGICGRTAPKPAAPSAEQAADYQDKMMRLGQA